MDFLKMLSQCRTPALDILFQGITLFAQEALVISIICWLYWCKNKKLAYTLGFAYFSSGLLVQGLKITFRIPRPWVLDPSFQPVASAIPAATGYSFPSGHTQSGTALFSSLCFSVKNRLLKGICIFLVLGIGFSRLYLGVHTPKDVLVSMILTFIISYIIWKKQDYFSGEQAHLKIISLLAGLICIALLVYACNLQFYKIIPPEEAEDCIKACGAGLGFSLGYYLEKRFIRFQTNASLRTNIFRFVIGMIVTLGLQQGLKPVLGTSSGADFVRYFIVVFWIIAIYPILFSKFKKEPA